MHKVISALLVMASVAANAQEILTLSEALSRSAKNNKKLIIARVEAQRAALRHDQSLAGFLPQIEISYSGWSTNNPLNAFGFRLQQEAIAPADFDPTRLNNPSAVGNFSAKAEWKQPILNLDLLHLRKAAHSEQTISEKKVQRAEEQIVFDITTTYMQLQLAKQSHEVMKESVILMEALLKNIRDKYQQGLIQKADLMNAEVQKIDIDHRLAEAASNEVQVSDYLSLLMGEPSGSVWAVSGLDTPDGLQMMDELPENRADLVAYREALVAREQVYASSRKNLLPRINGYAEFVTNDADAFGFGAQAYLAGVQMTWTIFSGFSSRKKAAEMKLAIKQAREEYDFQLEQAKIEFRHALRAYNNAQVFVRQQQQAIAQSEESYRITKNRFDQGVIATTEILQSQNQLSLQKLRLAQALFELRRLVAYLQFLTHQQ